MKTGIVALGLLLGAAAVAASAHVPSTTLGQNPVPTCSPGQDCVQVKK